MPSPSHSPHAQPLTTSSAPSDPASAQRPDGVSGQNGAVDNQGESTLAEYCSTHSGKTEGDDADAAEDKKPEKGTDDKAKRERDKKNAAKKPREQYSCVECFR